MKRLFIMALAVATLTACEKEIITEEDATVSDGSAIEKTKKFTFNVKGDFSNEWMTYEFALNSPCYPFIAGGLFAIIMMKAAASVWR